MPNECEFPVKVRTSFGLQVQFLLAMLLIVFALVIWLFINFDDVKIYSLPFLLKSYLF